MPSPPSPSTLHFDDDLGDRAAHALRGLIEEGRVADAASWLGAVRQWDARAFYVDSASRWPGRPAWLDRWVEASPDVALALLVRGDHAIHWAWAARGSAWEPLPGTAGTFDERLALAEADLRRAAEMDPTDPTAPCLLIRVARGRRLPLAEKFDRFQLLVARDPRHRQGHVEMLRSVTQKWGGSHDLMFQFARSARAEAPPGSPLHTLIVEAHIERWLLADRAGTEAGYWHRADVVADVVAAAAAYLAAPEAESTPLDVIDHSHLAFAFCAMGDWVSARRHLEAMSLPYRWPWAMFGDPAELITRARERAAAGA
ncbi:MAG: hypothetical protein ABSA40_02705 [Candidatus Dormibacteria bacterium]